MAAGAAFVLGKPFEGGLLILLSGVFDVLDGGVARAKGRITPFGGVLDSVCDRYSDGLMFLGIMAGAINGKLTVLPIMGIEGWLWSGYALIGSFLVSYTRGPRRVAGLQKFICRNCRTHGKDAYPGFRSPYRIPRLGACPDSGIFTYHHDPESPAGKKHTEQSV